MATSFDLDHTYLHETVSVPLTEAMAQLAILQPEDPIEFLGNFLLKHVANEEAQHRIKNQRKPSILVTPLDLAHKMLDGEDLQQHEIESERLLRAQLLNESSVTQMLERFAEWISVELNAEEAYIGRKCVNSVGAAIVHFIASSKHQKSSVIDKFVVQPENETIEDNLRGVGVTFDVFKEIEPVDENGNAAVDGESNALPAILPKYVHVENVLREPRVKSFGIPKLGALITRAGQYKSYLHADVYNESDPNEPNVLEQWLVFSADTMGQARAFTKKEAECFYHATERFLTILEEKERAFYKKEYERYLSDDEPRLREFSAAFAEQVAVQEENLATSLPALSEDEEISEASQQQRAAKEAEFRLSFLTTLLVSHKTSLSIESVRIVPVKKVVLSTYAAALELLGHTSKEMHSPATGELSWDKISPLLSIDVLAPCLHAFAASLLTINSLTEAGSMSASGLRAIRNALPATPAAMSSAKQIFNDTSKTELDAASPVASCFYVWGLAVIAHVDSLTIMIEKAQTLEDEAVAAGNNE